jgi:hypothetical protein
LTLEKQSLPNRRDLRETLLRISVLVAGVLPSVVLAQSVKEYPPALPPILAETRLPVNGGRVQSIAVNPTNRDHIIAAHQFGGLWKTLDGGRNWSHVRGLPAVFVADVAYGSDGRTIIATVSRDLKTTNGGGIWVSRDEGVSWAKTGTVPTTMTGLTRPSAYGISYAPDNPSKIYVGTDYGVAISTNNGRDWSQAFLGPAGPGAWSVQGLPGNRAIAVTRQAIYLKAAVGDAWSVIRRGSFVGGFKNIDVSPYDNSKIFILQDYGTLLLYDLTSNRWTVLPLPDGRRDRRGPFVRATRGTAGSQAIDLWVGLGVQLWKTSSPNFDSVRRLTVADWRTIGRVEGLHDDCGHLGLDAQRRLVMYGSDGGLFKPQNPEGTRWTLGSPGGSGMNSYQITSLAGTTYHPIVNPQPSLYITTQDNGIWGSPDGGRTWPNSDCVDGWNLQTWHSAHSTRDMSTRVAYGRFGCDGSPVRTSDADLRNPRDVPNLDQSGNPIGGMPFNSCLLSPGNWMRFVNRSVGAWSLHLSTDNLEHWQEIGTTSLNPSGRLFGSGGATTNPTTYSTFEGSLSDPSGYPRIALARMNEVLSVRPGEIIESSLIYLPRQDNRGGSLGVRATEFDWHPVYGVDPRDPDFLIAPDVVNETVWISTQGGQSWFPDDELTDRVTQGGTLLFYENNPGQVQVTAIAFSPYERNLIMVGTREAGVIYSDDRGTSWHTVPGSETMLYVTDFVFTQGETQRNIVYAATYGRGLWQIDMRRRHRLRDLNICGFKFGFCSLRVFADPARNVIQDFPWQEYNVLAVFGGRINGLLRSGEQIKSITVTPNSSYRFYARNDIAMPEITESKEGVGFENDEAAGSALKNQEIITGIILKDDGQVAGYLTNVEEFKADQEPLAPKTGKEVPADKPGSGLPYLSISTGSLLGPGMVQVGGTIRLLGAGFMQAAPVELRLDGKRQAEIKVAKDGRASYKIQVSQKLSMDRHRLEMVQKIGAEERKAVASFVVVRGADRSAGRQ